MNKLKLTLLTLAVLVLPLKASVFNKITYSRPTNLPAVYVETFTGDDVKSKGTYVYCRLILVSDTGTSRYDSVEIRGRGNASWGFAKKPYRIKFAKKQKFLGKGYSNARSWTLLSNGGEKTMMRNGLTSYVSSLFGMPFNPACRFVDFYLNDIYKGTYQISDQVQIRKKRVNIYEQEEAVTDPSADISGGYLLEGGGGIEHDVWFTSNMGTTIRIHSPDKNVINQNQIRYIRNHVNRIESTLKSSNYDNDLLGFRQYLDTTTFIGWYLTSEIGANTDIFWSYYFYKERLDKRFYFGPLWDFDLGYNDDSRHGDMTERLLTNIDFGNGYQRVWFNKIAQGEWFKTACYEHFHKLYNSGRLDSLMCHWVDSVAAYIDASQRLNYQVWSISAQTHLELNLFNTYEEYIADLKDFIIRHNAYLDATFDKRSPHVFKPSDESYYMILNKHYDNYVIAPVDSTLSETTAAAICYRRNGQTAQQWTVKRLLSGYYQIINVRTGKALCDTKTSAMRSAICVTDVNASDRYQLWQLVGQRRPYYNLKNVATGRVLTNYRDLPIDGNPLYGYTSLAFDGTNDSRIWFFRERPKVNPPDAVIAAQKDIDYQLNYDAAGHRLHFCAFDVRQLVFKATIYSLEGRVVGTFRGDEDFDTGSLADGTYIISWYFAGKSHSTRFLKH